MVILYSAPINETKSKFYTAIEEEGIFRLSGSANDIEKMRKKADQGLELTFHGIPYHNVSGIFKMFIRNLPVPIVTFELYNAFLAATSMIITIR